MFSAISQFRLKMASLKLHDSQVQYSTGIEGSVVYQFQLFKMRSSRVSTLTDTGSCVYHGVLFGLLSEPQGIR